MFKHALGGLHEKRRLFLCRLRMERMRLELNGGILYADLETFCFFAALV